MTYEIFSQTTLQHAQKQLEETQYSQYLERDELHDRDYKKRRTHMDDSYYEFDLAEYDALEGIPEMQDDEDLNRNVSQDSRSNNREANFVHSVIRNFTIALNTPHNSKLDSTQDSHDEDEFATGNRVTKRDQSVSSVHDSDLLNKKAQLTDPFATLASSHQLVHASPPRRSDPQTPPPRAVPLPLRREVPTAPTHTFPTSLSNPFPTNDTPIELKHKVHEGSGRHNMHNAYAATIASDYTPLGQARHGQQPTGAIDVADGAYLTIQSVSGREAKWDPRQDLRREPRLRTMGLPSEPSEPLVNQSESLPAGFLDNTFSVDDDLDQDVIEVQPMHNKPATNLGPNLKHPGPPRNSEFSQPDPRLQRVRSHSMARNATVNSDAPSSDDPWNGFLELSTQLAAPTSQRMHAQPLIRSRTAAPTSGSSRSSTAFGKPGLGVHSAAGGGQLGPMGAPLPGQKKAVDLASKALAKRASRKSHMGSAGIGGSKVSSSAFDLTKEGWSNSSFGFHTSAKRPSSVFHLDLASDEGLETMDVLHNPAHSSSGNLTFSQHNSDSGMFSNDTLHNSSNDATNATNALNTSGARTAASPAPQSPTSPIALATKGMRDFTRRVSMGQRAGGGMDMSGSGNTPIHPKGSGDSMLSVYTAAMSKLQQLDLLSSNSSSSLLDRSTATAAVPESSMTLVQSPPMHSKIESRTASALQLATNTLRSFPTWNTAFRVLLSNVFVQEGLYPVSYLLGGILGTDKNTSSPANPKNPHSLKKSHSMPYVSKSEGDSYFTVDFATHAKEFILQGELSRTSHTSSSRLIVEQDHADGDSFFSSVKKNLFQTDASPSQRRDHFASLSNQTVSIQVDVARSGGSDVAAPSNDDRHLWKTQVSPPRDSEDTNRIVQLDRLPAGTPALFSVTLQARQKLTSYKDTERKASGGTKEGEELSFSAPSVLNGMENASVSENTLIEVGKKLSLVTTFAPAAVWQRFYCSCHHDSSQSTSLANSLDPEINRSQGKYHIPPSKTNEVPFRTCYVTSLLRGTMDRNWKNDINGDASQAMDACLLRPLPENHFFVPYSYSHHGDCVILKYSVDGWIPIVHQSYCVNV